MQVDKNTKVPKMKCSICKQEGHNKRSCKKMTTPVSAPKIEAKTDVKVIPPVKVEMSSQRKEVQAHGFSWEKEIICNVYCATNEELKEIKYNSKMDLPANLNRLDKCDVSVKTSCSQNAVCMADCLRIYDAVNQEEPLHMTVVHYKQDDTTNTKKLVSIVEVDLTKSKDLLFGSLSREDVERLDKLVKSIPQKRKPTPEEHAALYALQAELQKKSGAIYMNIKGDSKQSRLQCSFNKFQEFITTNKDRIVAQSTSGDFRGKKVIEEVASGRRQFRQRSAEE
jgi:hypothetical protein